MSYRSCFYIKAWAILVWEQGAWSYRYADEYLSTLLILDTCKIIAIILLTFKHVFMKKFLFVLIFVSVNVFNPLFGQNKFNLMPDNMINYIGKITQPEFEKLVGEPVGYESIDNESDYVIYEVEPTYGQDFAPVIAIRCYFRESDGKLINVKFLSPYPLAYWMNFSRFKGYTEKNNYRSKRNSLNRIIQADNWYGSFGMQILNWERPATTPETAIINYHIVK